MLEPQRVELESTLSTQDEARNRLVRDAAPGTNIWVRTHQQSAGRGRQGRGWISHSGDLLISCALQLPIALRGRPLLTLVAGNALFDALGDLAQLPRGIFLKWPNDLFFVRTSGEYQKLAGVLAESAGAPGAVVGWGVNLVRGERVLATESAYRAGNLEDVVGRRLSALELQGALEKHFLYALNKWAQTPTEFEADFIAQLQAGPMAPLWGRTGILLPSQEAVEAIGLDSTGALRVRDARGKIQNVVSGEFKLSGPLTAP
ncbi:MAG: biotin--[acetyl-CoA-carboxylase] ligase [Bdellovibrionales bacterium]|nr:biotin--[acetyl-CoA-carboxylase] ligase [Bdellovibrionales bacterium]